MYIYVGNIDHEATKEWLLSLFEPFGAVPKAVVRKRGESLAFAILEMPNDAEGKAAINALTGSAYKNKRLLVNECGFDDGQDPFGPDHNDDD
jgi:cold-inducible RNA-binding protein